MTLSLWAEQMADHEVESALESLGRRGLGLGLHLPADRVRDDRFALLTRRSEDRGVPVRAWPLLSVEHGYWIGESNAALAAELLEAVSRWARSRGGPALSGLSIDLEPDIGYAEALKAAGMSRADRILRLLLSHVDPPRFQAARDMLAGAVSAVRRAGILVHAVTFPLLLDQPEGSTILEDALDVPLSGIEWDEVSFMVYQTPFAQLTGSWLGPSLVHSYARDAVARFGERAGIDLGVVGEQGIGLEPGFRYPDPETLALDRAAARAAGIPSSRTRIYGLAGALSNGGVEAWLAGEPEPSAPPPAREVTGLKVAVRAICTGLELALRR